MALWNAKIGTNTPATSGGTTQQEWNDMIAAQSIFNQPITQAVQAKRLEPIGVDAMKFHIGEVRWQNDFYGYGTDKIVCPVVFKNGDKAVAVFDAPSKVKPYPARLVEVVTLKDRASIDRSAVNVVLAGGLGEIEAGVVYAMAVGGYFR